METMRFSKGFNIGDFYWQIIDSWPVVSWSSIDYYNNRKAQHYRMRDVFTPLALGIESKDGKLNYYSMSDYLQDRNNLKLSVRVVDFNTGVKKEFTQKNHFFYWPNKLNLPETEVYSNIIYADEEYILTLWSNKLAKDVFIAVPLTGTLFSDNFIDLLPNENVTIKITSPKLIAKDKTPVTIKHVRETYN